MTVSQLILLLGLLTVKHYVCDFVFQSPYMLINKGIYGHWGGISHALSHCVLTLVVVIVFAPVPLLAILVFAEFIIHYHVDYFKVKLEQRYRLSYKSSFYWNLFGFDQMLHSLTYLWMIWMIV